MKNLRVFGVPCYVHVPKERRKKWDFKAMTGIFVGYSDNIEGYRIWLKSTNQIIRSRNVVFEPERPGKTLAWIPQRDFTVEEEVKEKGSTLPNSSIEDSSFEENQPMETPKLPERKLHDRAVLNPPRRLIELMLAEVDEPKGFVQAVNSLNKQHWKRAVKEEIASLKENSTWSLVELPVDRKAISNLWIYRVKRNAKGGISRYKARLIIREFSQREGIDYNETFSPVARFDTIRTVLSIAANEELEIAQFNVKTAFLNGVICGDIYMNQPEGHRDGTNRVCKLHTSLYGLKQSPRCWNDRFKEVMNSFGFKQSLTDPCMFYKRHGNEKIIFVLYVDDGLVAATNKTLISELLSNLKDIFRITVEAFGSFLNMMINRQENGSNFVSQKRYAESIVRRFNMEDANPVSIEKYQLAEETSDELTDVSYREAVGCLCTWLLQPDLILSTL